MSKRNLLDFPTLFSYTPTDTAQAFTSVESYLGDEYHNVFIPSNEFMNNTIFPANALSVGAGRTSGWQMTAAGTCGINHNQIRKQNWINGGIKVTVYYYGDVSDNTKNIKWGYLWTPFTSGSNVTTATPLDIQVTIAGPTTANLVQSYTFSTLAACTNPSVLFYGLRILRFGADAADTYTGNIVVLGVMLNYFNYIKSGIPNN